VILAGDLGGTKCVLALCSDAGVIQREQMFLCAEATSLEDIIGRFLGTERVRAAAIGVAGPVVGGVARITNLPWTIDERALGQRLGGPVSLMNDLQATALGMRVLAPERFAVLQAGEVPEHATIGVIAPGTGLGAAVLVSDGTRYRALPTESGHADFAPGTDEELALWKFLSAKFGGHVSVERILSGNGIGALYEFARQTSGVPEPTWLTHEIAGGDRNAVVSQSALAGNDPVCVKALSLFASILGAEAGNMALRTLALGGIVIGGGIPPKILPLLQTGALLDRFVAKGRFEGWMRKLPLRVALEPRAALLGASHVAATL
jgi:glucokinase